MMVVLKKRLCALNEGSWRIRNRRRRDSAQLTRTCLVILSLLPRHDPHILHSLDCGLSRVSDHACIKPHYHFVLVHTSQEAVIYPNGLQFPDQNQPSIICPCPVFDIAKFCCKTILTNHITLTFIDWEDVPRSIHRQISFVMVNLIYHQSQLSQTQADKVHGFVKVY